jgi:hypothetical protein
MEITWNLLKASGINMLQCFKYGQFDESRQKGQITAHEILIRS